MEVVYIIFIFFGICLLGASLYVGYKNLPIDVPTSEPGFCNETSECMITHYCKNNKCVPLDKTFMQCRMNSQCDKPKKCKEINPPAFIGFCV